MRIIDYVETQHQDRDDSPILEEEIDFDKYQDLRSCAEATIGRIHDDQQFCDAEWNMFHHWRDEKGFTEDDWKYIEACGYEKNQFGCSTKGSKWNLIPADMKIYTYDVTEGDKGIIFANNYEEAVDLFKENYLDIEVVETYDDFHTCVIEEFDYVPLTPCLKFMYN